MKKEKITKQKLIEWAKQSKKLHGFVEYDEKYFKINVEGEIVNKQESQITLKNIHELVVGLKEETTKLNSKIDNLETKVDNLETETKQRFDKLETETKQRFNNLEIEVQQRFDQVEKRLDQVEKRLDKLEG